MAKQLTDEIIDAAIEGYVAQKARLDQKIAELQGMRSGDHHGLTAAALEAAPHKRRKFSAEAIRRMREAQQRRWARVRGEAQLSAAPPAKPKRKLSAAARAKLVANLKKARAAKARKQKQQA